MSSRTVMGALSILLFSQEFITVNQLPFNYHAHPLDLDDPVDFRKGTYLLSIKYFQHILNKYDNPKIGDLVIVEGPDKALSFKTVEALPQTYYSDPLHNLHYYVPNGYIVLRSPETAAVKMQEFIANVRGSDHYALPW